MAIDKIGSVDPISRFERKEGVVRPGVKKALDSVNVSGEARRSAEVYQAIEVVKAAPDIREARVEEVRARLEDPNYANDAVVKVVVDRLMEDLLGL